MRTFRCVALFYPRLLALFYRLLRSFRNRGAQDLCPEEPALCSLNDLLVYALRGVVHNDCAGLVVNLGVDACVADQVDDPLLTLVLRQAKACGEVPVGLLALVFIECAAFEAGEFGERAGKWVATHLMSIRWWILQ